MKFLPSLSKILILGLFLRLLWGLLIPVIPISDSAAYDTFAINIWLHGTYGWEADAPYSYWPVGTSGLYSIIYSIFGHTYWPIVLLNCGFSLGIIYYTYTLAQIAFKSCDIARLSALIIAIWPTGILFVTILGSELPYMMLSMAGIHFFFSSRKNIVLAGLLVGACFSLAYYVRPQVTVPFVICIFCAIVVMKDKVRIVAIKSLVCAALMIVAVTPWAIRNYNLHDAFVPMSSNGGAVFWMGNQPGSNGGYVPTPPSMADMDTNLRSQLLKQEALDYIKSEPFEFVSRTLYKFIKFHSYETIGVTWNQEGITKTFGENWITPLKIFTQGTWLIIVILGWGGLIFAIYKLGFWTIAFNPVTLFWASNAAIHSIIVSQDRYHIPSVPFISIYAAFVLMPLVTRYIKSAKLSLR